MRANNSLSSDNSGVSVLIEYIFIIMITATFFAMFLLLVNATIRNTDQIVVGQELGIVANDVTNRISYFSSKVNNYMHNSPYWTSNVSGYSEAIDLPELAQGKQYFVVIKYNDSSKTGNVTVYYGSNTNINRTVSFRSGTNVANTTISSTDTSPKIYYYPDNRTIMVVGF
jgi:hypothetical protein